MKKSLFYGILASLFFAFTFVFNRSMNLGGGYWIWSASLRYLFTLPIMWLLTALFGKPVPVKNLGFSGVILAGIFLLQLSHFQTMEPSHMGISFCLILAAAFAYPLGNRKMMSCCPENMTTVQRVFGMTLCSMPFWILLSLFALIGHGFPETGQIVQSFIVALFSGVVATVLFFEATNMTKHNQRQLAVIEATQSGEVLFTLLGGILFLGDPVPSAAGFAGIALVIAGMVGGSLVSAK